ELITSLDVLSFLDLKPCCVFLDGAVVCRRHLGFTRLIKLQPLGKLRPGPLLLVLILLQEQSFSFGAASVEKRKEPFKDAWFPNNQWRNNRVYGLRPKQAKPNFVTVGLCVGELKGRERPAINKRFPVDR